MHAPPSPKENSIQSKLSRPNESLALLPLSDEATPPAPTPGHVTPSSSAGSRYPPTFPSRVTSALPAAGTDLPQGGHGDDGVPKRGRDARELAG